MSLCVYTFVYMYICVYKYLYIYVYTYMHICRWAISHVWISHATIIHAQSFDPGLIFSTRLWRICSEFKWVAVSWSELQWVAVSDPGVIFSTHLWQIGTDTHEWFQKYEWVMSHTSMRRDSIQGPYFQPAYDKLARGGRLVVFGAASMTPAGDR